MPTETRADGPAEQLLRACLELRRRLDAGEDCHAEDLLAAFPALAGSEEHAVDLICTEVLARRQRGEVITPETWLVRFPRWRASLQRQFRTHGLLPSGTTWEQSPAPTPDSFSSAGDTEPEAVVQAARRYEILSELGRGGMGIVYRARDRLLDRVVALKKLRNGPGAHAEEVRRFFREARALARLRHPHIVPVYDIGADGEDPFFTMDFVAGGALKDRRDLFGGDVRTVVALMAKVAGAVHAAHDEGIIHRDLKPANVLLDADDEPRVSDFGLAKLADADESLTREGQTMGTPAYMAPEQVAGQARDASVRTDIWSLGVILYELVVGTRPYSGRSLQEIAQQHRTLVVRRPRACRPQLHPHLETIILKCLEPEPARRYLSAGALAEDLRQWLHGGRIAARSPSWPRRAWRVVRRHPVWAAAVVLLLCAAVTAPLGWHLIALARPQGDQDRRPAIESGADPREGTDSDRPAKDYYQRLVQRQPVTLIGETGPPAWSRWRVRGGGVIPSNLSDGTFTLTAADHSLLELLPALPPGQAFRFRAEVRHQSSTARLGQVGIYFAHAHSGTAPDTHGCGTLSYNDFQTLPVNPNLPPGHAPVTFGVLGYHEPGKEGKGELAIAPFRPNVLQAPGTPSPWRSLAVVVTPAEVEVFWEGKPLATPPGTGAAKQSLRNLRDQMELVFQSIPVPDRQPQISPEGGLGLYVSGGEVSFRRVVVEPYP
jgi:hypothetical protein